MAAANIMSDVELVRDQAGTLTAQAAVRHTELFAGILTRAITQCKAVHTVNLPGKQTVLRFAEHQFAIKENFTQGYAGLFSIQASTDIGQQAIFFFYFFDLHLPAVMAGNGITRVEHHAGHGGITACVQTVFTSRWEK